MSVKAITPYLFFDGDAAQAVQLYQSALGAQVENLQHYSDMPEESPGCGSGDSTRVMHACLRVGEARLMASDVPADQPGQTGSQVHVCLDFDDVRAMQRSFDALAAGGQVTMAVHDAFWGSKFGMLVDAFGIQWMFTCPVQPS